MSAVLAVGPSYYAADVHGLGVTDGLFGVVARVVLCRVREHRHERPQRLCYPLRTLCMTAGNCSSRLDLITEDHNEIHRVQEAVGQFPRIDDLLVPDHP